VEGLSRWEDRGDRGIKIEGRTVSLHFRGARPFVSLNIERLMGVPFARASGM